VLRLGAAVALLVAGLVHLDLYFGGYRDAGDVPSFGRSIVFNAVVSAVLAVAVAVRREWFVRLAGLLFAAGTLGALWYSHRVDELFGFAGSGFQPSPQAQLVVVAEAAAIVTLALTFVPAIDREDRSWGSRTLAGTALAAAAVMAVGAIVWSDRDDSSAAATGPASVTIADFTFGPGDLTVPAGTTVTWTNDDPFAHTLVAVDGSFTSPELAGGDQFEFTFEAAGTYAYVCGIHPSMAGTVTVTE
jgi:plastocyanin